jgi:outer membrane cobalamin receptor
MRVFRAAVAVGIFLATAFAAELKVKVVDPQSAPVAGAQVEVYSAAAHKALAIQTTAADGGASLSPDLPGPYRVRILAPGFAEETLNVSAAAQALTVRLRLAPASETVVVSATRYPVAGDLAGAVVETLGSAQLDTMRPVAANDALRFLPGAIVATSGQRGGLASLFVRGGDSRYNKVIIDGVPANDPGGTVDFGTLPLFEESRVEFLRGSQSTLYGSDAMTSVVQIWSRTGSTPVPELRFGADAGNFSTESGYASLSGARGRFDFNVFGNQFNTIGSSPNDDYSNSLEGLNVGAKLTDWASARVRVRHDNSVAGVQNEWNFNGAALLPPDLDQRARQNNLLGSLEISIIRPSRWQHRITAFEYSLHRTNVDSVDQGNRISPFGDQDFQFHALNNENRAGFDYDATYAERTWALTTFGYEFEDEHGSVGNLPDLSAGLRRNHALFAEQTLTFPRAFLVAGGRYVHNESFGNKFVPRVALSLLVSRGGQLLSGTRLRFEYATGIKEPSFAESFGNGGSFPTLPNTALKPEETRSLGAGFEQKLAQGYSITASYFNNLFRNKIDFNVLPCFCEGQYVNVDKALAHGVEVEFHGLPLPRLSFDSAYTYTSTQILQAPFCTAANFCDPVLAAGSPLLRRPKHSASVLLSYLGTHWGGNVGASFVGRRPDSDFFGFNIEHAAGYVRADLGGWYAIHPRITAYVNVENALDRRYNEVVGYPALPINFRAGLRFRIGGE